MRSFFCVFFATGLPNCATAPAPEKLQVTEPEKAPITEPENRALSPRAGKASKVTEFTKLVYAEETIKQAKINHDKEVAGFVWTAESIS